MKKVFSKITKGLFYAYISTFILIAFFATLITYTNISENKLELFVNIITIVSLIIGGFYVGKKADNKGWLWGMIVGFLYILIIMIVNVIILKRVSFAESLNNLVLVSILGGLVGGIIGINAKNMSNN